MNDVALPTISLGSHNLFQDGETKHHSSWPNFQASTSSKSYQVIFADSSALRLKISLSSFSDLQPRRARPGKVGPRDRQGHGQGPAAAGGRVHAGRRHQRQERQRARLRQVLL